MEQLWYTSCRNGLGSGSGYTVRAASPGLKDLRSERYARLGRYLRYTLPAGANPNTTRSHEAPRVLALLNTGKERILIHQVYVGPDYTGMRYGNHFTHLITDVPDTYAARQASALWRSEFWAEREDRLPPGVYDLPLVEPDNMKPGDLSRGHLDTQEMRQWLEFTIRAFLLLSPTGTLYIAAPSDTVAALIWGLTRCLPIPLLADLTFITYTHDIGAVSARIVGTGGLARSASSTIAAVLDLPTAAYGGQNLAFSGYSGNASPLRPSRWIETYARFAVDALVGLDPNLDALLQAAEIRPGITIPQYLELYRLFDAVTGNNSPNLSDLATILADRDLAARLLGYIPMQEALLSACRIDPESDAGKYWQEKLRPALDRVQSYSGALPQLQTALTKLQARAVTACQSALIADDLPGAKRLLDQILMWPKGEALPETLDLLCRGLHANQVTNLDARIWLLERAAEVRSPDAAGINLDVLSEWLHVPWPELRILLAHRTLPLNWRIYAAQNAIQRQESFSQDAAALADEYADALLPAFTSLAQHSDTFGFARNYFLAVVEGEGRNKLSLLSILLKSITEQEGAGKLQVELLQAARLTAVEVKRAINENPKLEDNVDTAQVLVGRCLDPDMDDRWMAISTLLERPQLASELLKPSRPGVQELFLDCVTLEPLTWRLYVGRALAQLREVAEPAELRFALQGLVDAARSRAVRAFRDGHPEDGSKLFDQLIAPTAPMGPAAELVALGDDLVLNFDPQSDADEAEQLREWVLQRAYQYHFGTTHEGQDQIDRMVRPWLVGASKTGLLRLTNFLDSLTSRRGEAKMPESGLPSFLEEWFSVARQSVGSESMIRRTLVSPTYPSSTLAVEAVTSVLSSLSLEQQESTMRDVEVVQNLDRYIDQFKKASLHPEEHEAAIVYFGQICRVALEKRIELIDWAYEVAPWTADSYLDRLIAKAQLLDEKHRPDMVMIERLLVGRSSRRIVLSLRDRPASRHVLQTYLSALSLEACQSEVTRSALKNIAKLEGSKEDSELEAMRRLAVAWLAVDLLAKAETADQRREAADQVGEYLLDIAKATTGGGAVVGDVVNLMIIKSQDPHWLTAFMQNSTCHNLEICPGRRIGEFRDAYLYFLRHRKEPSRKDEATRLLPFAQIACSVAGELSLGDYQLKACQHYLLGYLKDADSATIQELSRLVDQLAQRKRSPYLSQVWHQFLLALPAGLQPSSGFKNKVVSLFRNMK